MKQKAPKNRHFGNKLIDDKAGVTAVGFAMVFPATVTVVLALFHIGVGFFGIQQAQATTELVARMAFTMNDPTAEEIKALVSQNLGTTLGGSFTPNVVVTEKYGSTYADIQIAFSYKPVIPFLSDLKFETTTSTEVLIRNLD